MSAERLRVAMLILEYDPVQGGAQRQLQAVAPLLQARGIEVQVVTRSVAGRPAYEEVRDVAVHRLPAPGPKAVASAVFRSTALAKLRELRPDVIQAFSLFSPCAIASLAKRRWGTPNLVKVLRGGMAGDAVRLERKPFAARRIRALCRDIDRFATISREIEGELLALGVARERLAWIPNGVDTGRFRPAAPERVAPLRRELGLPDGPVAVYTGRLVPEKRVERLVDLWPGLCAELGSAAGQVTLVVVGDGPERASLERRAAGSAAAGGGVRFVGATDDVVPWLQAADLYVLPSDTEGLSNAMLEAMACGLPAIVTQVGGAADAIAPGESGLLVPPGDESALRAGLLRLLRPQAAGERRAMGERARVRVQAAYSLVTAADRLATTFVELADTSRGRRAHSPARALAVRSVQVDPEVRRPVAGDRNPSEPPSETVGRGQEQ